jgi:hypothetical protein
MGAETTYVGIRIQGGLLPAELLSRLAAGKSPVPGTTSADYGLAAGETIREAANRVWAYLTTAWAGYRAALDQLPGSDRATTLTRDRWLSILLDQLGYGRVPHTSAGGITVDGKPFPVSHQWGPVPVHLLGARVDLDRRTAGVAGAAAQAPQSMLQELLNRSEANLWAVLSNGSTLRLLRDSTSLVGSAYIEFDLEAIFEGELFSDFLMLFTICHASRLEVRDGETGPTSCWLEQWREIAVEDGSRALDQLRDGVVEALQTLGSGFLAHPGNAELRRRVEDGELSLADYNHALLRIIYRLLFSFVAEDRGVLLSPDAPPEARARFADFFSTDRLRRIARRRRGGRHGDRWQSLQVVWQGLGSDVGRPELGLTGIGGLFEHGELDFLAEASLSNESLLKGVRSLTLIRERGSSQLRVVNYRDLDAEELGSIYEALLEYVPAWDGARRKYTLGSAAGNIRKTTGSYYTPTSLIESLLDTALDPVLDDAEKRGVETGDIEAELLAVTVCDPACGSGHFLVAAARRIAKRLAAARTGDPEPPPEQIRTALREVIGHCVYGVDLNPLAAELAKVSLWLEAMEPGRPLTFLDAQIKVGNALIGATPALLDGGLPQEAFKPIEGDDKKLVATLARRNKEEAGGQGTLFGAEEARASNTKLVEAASRLVGAGLSLADIHVQQRRLRQYLASPVYRQAKQHADAWCAAFVWPKTADAPTCPTNATLDDLRDNPAVGTVAATTEQLTAEYRFFHWHLEFPHIFPTERPEIAGTINKVTGWYGGFAVILGNPPWEHVELKEQEFFDARDPDIAKAAGARRKKLIEGLVDTNPGLHAEYATTKRRIDGLRHFAANSGRYPLCGRGRIKTDPIFAELGRHILGGDGRFGLILPTGIATDATTQYFFRDLVEKGALSSLYDFENRKPLFDGVDSRFKFCLLTLAGREQHEPRAEFAFFARDPVDLQKADVRFGLTPEEIKLLNPNTGTCPVFRSRRDAEITLGIYRRVPVLIKEGDANGNPWGIRFMQGLFNMTSDSHLFHTRDELEADGWTLVGNVFERPTSNRGMNVERMLPLYQGMMTTFYDHRAADVVRSASAQTRQNQPRYLSDEDKTDPNRLVFPQYWVGERLIDDGLPDWLLAFSDITSPTNERTLVPVAIPRAGVGNKLPLMLGGPTSLHCLLVCLSSFVVDFLARQKVGGTTLNYFYMKQFAVLPPSAFAAPAPWDGTTSISRWMAPRVAELVATAVDMACFAEGAGVSDSPFRWDVGRRALLRTELDAAIFHLYGVQRADVDYIMETFPIVKRKDQAAYGEYRTKRLILEIYDQMADAIANGSTYVSPFDEEDL